MLHHFATATDTGPCVAYWQGVDVAVVVCECLTEAAAAQEAARLNFEGRARQALQQQAEQAATTRRRRIARYFEPDAFA